MTPRLVARSSGVGLYECGAEVWVVPHRSAWMHVAAFVAGLIAVIGVVNGTVVVARHGPPGLGILGVATLAAVSSALLVRSIRRRHAAAPDVRDALVVFDLAAKKLLDGGRRPLADFAQLKLERRFQLGSSSPALAVEWPGGSRTLVRGSPFAGGVADVEERLSAIIAG